MGSSLIFLPPKWPVSPPPPPLPAYQTAPTVLPWSSCSAVHQESLEVISGELDLPAVCTQLGNQTEMGGGKHERVPHLRPGWSRRGIWDAVLIWRMGTSLCRRKRPEPVSIGVGSRAALTRTTMGHVAIALCSRHGHPPLTGKSKDSERLGASLRGPGHRWNRLCWPS